MTNMRHGKTYKSVCFVENGAKKKKEKEIKFHNSLKNTQ